MAFYIFGNDGKLFFNNILFIMLLEVKKQGLIWMEKLSDSI